MKIRDMFYRGIDREINGVIKVGQKDKENVYQELDEYVVTEELEKYMNRFFDAYIRGLNGKTDKMGVWISGFFGSGKSHFLKILSYILSDRMFFELMYEVYREKLRLGDEEFKDSDLNIFFSAKATQDQTVASWTEATVKKLKGTYAKFLVEAGILRKVSYRGKEVVRPYIDLELRDILLRNKMDKYLFALTGEQ